MANVNVDERWWADPRRAKLAKLVGSVAVADGLAASVWRLSQTYWKNGRGQVPLPVFMTVEHFEEYLEAGLAVIKGDFVYVRGSEEFHDWLASRSEAGQKGGKRSAKSRQRASAEIIDDSGKQTQANASKPKQAQPSSSSSSSSSFSKDFKNTKAELLTQGGAFAPADTGQELIPEEARLPEKPKRSKFNPETRAKMQAFIARYAELYRAKYGGPPEQIRDPAIIGKLGHWLAHVSIERALQLAEVFLQIDHRPIAESQHDLWQFFRHLNRIGNALHTGTEPGAMDWAKVFGQGAA